MPPTKGSRRTRGTACRQQEIELEKRAQQQELELKEREAQLREREEVDAPLRVQLTSLISSHLSRSEGQAGLGRWMPLARVVQAVAVLETRISGLSRGNSSLVRMPSGTGSSRTASAHSDGNADRPPPFSSERSSSRGSCIGGGGGGGRGGGGRRVAHATGPPPPPHPFSPLPPLHPFRRTPTPPRHLPLHMHARAPEGKAAAKCRQPSPAGS